MMDMINDNIIKRTKQLFLTIFQIEIEDGLPYTVDPDNDTGWDISGVIGVTGDLSGLITMRYHKKFAEFLLERSKLHDKKTDMSQSLMNDMIGEVANTITGNVMSESGVKELLLSVPVAIQGKNHIISWPKNTEITAIPFKIGSETFVVQKGLK